MSNVLLVVGDKASLTAGDSALQTRLTTTLGHTVTLASDEDAVPSLSGVGLIILTQSGTSANLGSKYDTVAVPVFTLNAGGMLTLLRLATQNVTNQTGTTTTIDLQNTAHAINTGLTDPLTIFSTAQTRRAVGTSTLASGATEIARRDDAVQEVAAVYDAGATLTTGTAPARRAFHALMQDAYISALTADGWTHFDRFVTWLVGDGSSPLSASASTTANTILTTGTATLTATATGGSGSYTYAWTVFSGPAAAFGSSTAASTTFTPTGGAGTYVLRCTVDDGTNSATADVTVTVATPASYVTYASVDVATGWTPTGGTNLAVLTDASGATYTTSTSNPSGLELTGTLGALTAPGAGVPLTVLIDCDKVTASSGSMVAKLYEGATLRSTVNVASIPSGSVGSAVSGQVTVNFPAVDIAAVTSWAALKLTLLVTAEP